MRIGPQATLTIFARVSVLAIAGACFAPANAYGQTTAESREVTLDVRAGPLGPALAQFGEQAGVSLVYPAVLAQGRNTNGVRGRMTVEEGLRNLLSGSDLSFRASGPRTFAIEPTAPATAGEHVLGAVRVEGTQGSPYFGGAGVAAGVNGINGSRDITATEGTKSFTSGALTVGSKVPQALKDVPQSLSVLTNERLEQQNVTDFTSALKQLPGVTLVQGGTSLDNNFYSRGFAIRSVQLDGGAPLYIGNGYSPQIDMSVYDHVELLRGADGLFNGYGDPSGSVNLVRKKPLDHAQYAIEGQAGSWSNYRVVADATSPLGFDGRLRGRLVMTWQDNRHFYKIAKDNKELIYGIAEFDATPTTLLTAGINYTQQDSVPWQNGLPRYQTGADLKLPRSECLCFPWNRWDFKTTEIFGGLEQTIGRDWTFKLNLTENRQRNTKKIGYSNGAVNPTNNLGPALAASNIFDNSTDQFSAEAVLAGAFELFGQRQEITLGVNRANQNGAKGQLVYLSSITSSPTAPYQPYPGGPSYCYSTNPRNPCPAGTIPPGTPPINVFAFDPYALIYSEPRNGQLWQRFNTLGQIQSLAYLNLRLTAFDRLHLTTGVRWSRYESKQDYDEFCTSPQGFMCTGKQIGDVAQHIANNYSNSNFSWPPAANLSFDVTKQLSAYAGYTDIYVDQSTNLDSNLKPLAPITGSNIEGGLKWAPRSGRLNLSLAGYRIRKKGFATLDGFFDDNGNFVASNGKIFPNGGQIDPIHFCCYIGNPNRTFRSTGVDFEATGEILPGWQVAASYNYSETKFEGSAFGRNNGQPFLSIQPKNLYKLWTSYDFGPAGHGGALSGLTLSGGVNGQSHAYFAGTGCKPEFIVTNPVTGAASCGPGGSYAFQFTVPSYAVFSARVDYRLTKRWALAVNLENILDKTYYQTVGGGVTGGNWYGSPRSVTVSVRGKW